MNITKYNVENHKDEIIEILKKHGLYTEEIEDYLYEDYAHVMMKLEEMLPSIGEEIFPLLEQTQTKEKITTESIKKLIKSDYGVEISRLKKYIKEGYICRDFSEKGGENLYCTVISNKTDDIILGIEF